MSSSNNAEWQTVSNSKPQQQANTWARNAQQPPQQANTWARNAQQPQQQANTWSRNGQQSQSSTSTQQRPQSQTNNSQQRPQSSTYQSSSSQSSSYRSSSSQSNNSQHHPQTNPRKPKGDNHRRYGIVEEIDKILLESETWVEINAKLLILYFDPKRTQEDRGKIIEIVVSYNMHEILGRESDFGKLIVKYYSGKAVFAKRGTEDKAIELSYNLVGIAAWTRWGRKGRDVRAFPRSPDDILKTISALMDLGVSPFRINAKNENIFQVLEVAVTKGNITRETGNAIKALVLHRSIEDSDLMFQSIRTLLAYMKDKDLKHYYKSAILAAMLIPECRALVFEKFFDLDLAHTQSTDVKRATAQIELHLYFDKLIEMIREDQFHDDFVDHFKTHVKAVRALIEKIADYYLQRLMTLAPMVTEIDISNGHSGGSDGAVECKCKSPEVFGAFLSIVETRANDSWDLSNLPKKVQVGFYIDRLSKRDEEDNGIVINAVLKIYNSGMLPQSAKILIENAFKTAKIKMIEHEVTEKVEPKPMFKPEPKAETKAVPKAIAQLSLAPQKRSFSIKAPTVTPVQQLANSRSENGGALTPAQQLAKTRLENAGALNPDAVDAWGQEIKNQHLGKYGLPLKPVPIPEPEPEPVQEPEPEPELEYESKYEPELKYESKYESKYEPELKQEPEQEPKPNALSEEQQLAMNRLKNAEDLSNAEVIAWQEDIKRADLQKYELPPQEPTLKVKSALETLVTGFEGNELERKLYYADTSLSLRKFLQDHSPEEVARQFIVKACANLALECVIEHVSPYIKYLDKNKIISKSVFQTLINTSKAALIENALEIKWDADADTVYAAFEKAVSK